jgi:hypothetical protein
MPAYYCSRGWHTSSNLRVRIRMTSTSFLPSNTSASHSCPTHASQVLCSECKLNIVHTYNHRICLINVRNSGQMTLRYVFGTHCSPMYVKATLSLTQMINNDNATTQPQQHATRSAVRPTPRTTTSQGKALEDRSKQVVEAESIKRQKLVKEPVFRSHVPLFEMKRVGQPVRWRTLREKSPRLQ